MPKLEDKESVNDLLQRALDHVGPIVYAGTNRQVTIEALRSDSWDQETLLRNLEEKTRESKIANRKLSECFFESVMNTPAAFLAFVDRHTPPKPNGGEQPSGMGRVLREFRKDLRNTRDDGAYTPR